MMRILSFFLLSLLCCCCFSCEEPFAYSVYEADVPSSYRDTNAKNLALIKQLEDEPVNRRNDSYVKVALLSDTHYHYEELRDAIDHINMDTSVDFIVVLGDITRQALLKEFKLYHKVMSASQKPFLTLIGNHEYLSNGASIFRQMFGPPNMSFTYRNVKFILFDNIFVESRKTPDFDWIRSEIEGSSEAYVLPFAHIPPSDGQFTDEYRSFYHNLLLDNSIDLSLHGHSHQYSLRELYGGGVMYLTTPSPQRHSYTTLAIAASGKSIEIVNY